MKNQYFGDRRDLFKYDLLADLAGCLPDSRLVFIPMLTPNDDSGEGGLTRYSRGNRRGPLVDVLRDAVASGTRNIQILRKLMPSFGVKFMPHRDADHFQDATRAEYFAAVPTQWLAGSVVFFDPDIGLQTGTTAYMGGKGAEKYLMYADLRGVWARSSDDSVFVVYQHLQNDATKRTGDLARRLRELSEHLAAASVWAVQWTDVAFLVAVRNGPLAARVRLLLDEHSQRHAALLSEVGGQPRSGSPARPRDGARATRLKGTPMASAPKMTSCEVQSGTEWKRISISEALDRNERNGRCVECHMPVRAHRQATNGMAAHFEHLTSNPQCSFSDRRVARRPQPSPLSTPELRKQSPDAHSVPSAVKPLSVGELGDLKRRLVGLLNSFDVGSQPQRESIWKRINRLSSKGGTIPRDIAALMTVITEWRNSAEHEARVLSTTESAAVRHAWQAIQEWEQKRKK